MIPPVCNQVRNIMTPSLCHACRRTPHTGASLQYHWRRSTITARAPGLAFSAPATRTFSTPQLSSSGFYRVGSAEVVQPLSRHCAFGQTLAAAIKRRDHTHRSLMFEPRLGACDRNQDAGSYSLWVTFAGFGTPQGVRDKHALKKSWRQRNALRRQRNALQQTC